MIVDTVFKALGSGLELLAEREKNYSEKRANKLEDKRKKLERDFYEEDNKPEGSRDLAKLDVIRFELNQLCLDFSTAVREQSGKNS